MPKPEEVEEVPAASLKPHRHRDRMTLGETVDAIEEIAAEPNPFVYGYRFTSRGSKSSWEPPGRDDSEPPRHTSS